MTKAWNKGTCSTHEFRKCLSSDIEFIIDFNNAIAKKQEQKANEERMINAMNNLNGGMSHG